MAQESILEENVHGAPNGPISVQNWLRRLHRPNGTKDYLIRKTLLKVTQGMRENVENFVMAHNANLHVILDIFLHALLPSVASVSSE